MSVYCLKCRLVETKSGGCRRWDGNNFKLFCVHCELNDYVNYLNIAMTTNNDYDDDDNDHDLINSRRCSCCWFIVVVFIIILDFIMVNFLLMRLKVSPHNWSADIQFHAGWILCYPSQRWLPTSRQLVIETRFVGGKPLALFFPRGWDHIWQHVQLWKSLQEVQMSCVWTNRGNEGVKFLLSTLSLLLISDYIPMDVTGWS